MRGSLDSDPNLLIILVFDVPSWGIVEAFTYETMIIHYIRAGSW